MGRKKIMLLVLLAIIAGAGLIAAYFAYNSYYYVSTDDARISADIVTVAPQISGRVVAWDVKEGDMVEKDSRLGFLDASGIMTTAESSITAFNQSAGSSAIKSEVAAPISGRVIQVKARTGMSVSPGQTLAMIANVKDLYISANLEETVITKIKPGQRVDIKIDAFPGQTFSGRVDSIGDAATSVFSLLPVQSSNGNFTKVTQVIPVKIRFPELSRLETKLGMNVNVRIHLRQGE